MRFSYRLLLLILSLCALGAQAQIRTRGIDVSKFQGNINWTKVAKDSTIQFVYVRATEGTTIQDAYYKTNISKAKKAGLLVGSYHVYSSKTTAYQQMANMRKMIKKKEQDLAPVLDIEGHHSGRLYMQRVDKLLELMESEYGVKPVIYTSEKVYREHFAGKRYAKYHIFVAKYEGYPEVRFTLWQYSRTGRVRGIAGDVDLDKFHSKHSLKDIRIPRLPKKKKAAPTAEPVGTTADTAQVAQ